MVFKEFIDDVAKEKSRFEHDIVKKAKDLDLQDILGLVYNFPPPMRLEVESFKYGNPIWLSLGSLDYKACLDREKLTLFYDKISIREFSGKEVVEQYDRLSEQILKLEMEESVAYP